MSKYQLGNKWSPDFDYEGMYEAAGQVTDQTPLEDLVKLHSSFEDVNHHSESAPLWQAILAKRRGDETSASERLVEFKTGCE